MINLKIKDIPFPVCPIQETEYLHQLLVAHCICTILVCQLETLLIQCFAYTKSREAMLQSGNGFKSIIPERFYQREKDFRIYHRQT